MSTFSAIGIDLGTTYSAAAILGLHGQPEIIPNADSERLTPSAVFLDGDGMLTFRGRRRGFVFFRRA